MNGMRMRLFEAVVVVAALGLVTTASSPAVALPGQHSDGRSAYIAIAPCRLADTRDRGSTSRRHRLDDNPRPSEWTLRGSVCGICGRDLADRHRRRYRRLRGCHPGGLGRADVDDQLVSRGDTGRILRCPPVDRWCSRRACLIDARPGQRRARRDRCLGSRQRPRQWWSPRLAPTTPGPGHAGPGRAGRSRTLAHPRSRISRSAPVGSCSRRNSDNEWCGRRRLSDCVPGRDDGALYFQCQHRPTWSGPCCRHHCRARDHGVVVAGGRYIGGHHSRRDWVRDWPDGCGEHGGLVDCGAASPGARYPNERERFDTGCHRRCRRAVRWCGCGRGHRNDHRYGRIPGGLRHGD